MLTAFQFLRTKAPLEPSTLLANTNVIPPWKILSAVNKKE